MNRQLTVGAGSAPIQFSQEMFPFESFCAVHDDPMARVLVLNCKEQVAIVCLELVMLAPDGIDAARKAVSEITNTKYENIWVHVTHAITTPHAPHAPMGPGGVPVELSEEEKAGIDRKKELYDQSIIRAVIQAAKNAAELRPARMGLGSGTCSVNVNRDVETPYGWWINFNPDGPSNHTATVLQFADMDQKPVATLISYGLKPCAIDNSEMGNDTRLISSDVPGLACRLLEEYTGAPCLFAMSAAGDQVPVEQAWYETVDPDGTVRKVDHGVQAGLEIVDRLGHQMTDEVKAILDTVVCDQDSPEISLGESHFEWPGMARIRKSLTKQANYKEEGMHRVDTAAMLIGDVALVGLKPELNTITEAQLQEQSPFAHTLVMSMVNGGFKYMPDLRSYENCTWEAQGAPVMPGAAEAWVTESVKLLTALKRKK